MQSKSLSLKIGPSIDDAPVNSVTTSHAENKSPTAPTKIFIASDHAGFETKSQIIATWGETLWQDLGPTNTDSIDYPDSADKVAREVNQGLGLGILICGSGQGMALRANKYPNVRAALCWTPEVAQLSREHNNANIICLGSRLLEWPNLSAIIEVFFTTQFAGGRHQRRVTKIKASI